MYKLDDGEKRPEMGTLNYNTFLQVVLFCRKRDKWDKTPYVDMFFYFKKWSQNKKKA